MELYVRHPVTHEKKKRKQGFSWTTLLFGFWPAVFRADWKYAAIGFGFWLAGLVLILPGLIYAIVGGFKYNEWHLNDLRDKGFVEISSAEFYGVSQPMAREVGPAQLPGLS